MRSHLQAGWYVALYRLRPASILAAGLVGCSSQQLYAAGQASQRTDCNRLIVTQDRQKCMAGANTSFEHEAIRQLQQADVIVAIASIT